MEDIKPQKQYNQMFIFWENFWVKFFVNKKAKNFMKWLKKSDFSQVLEMENLKHRMQAVLSQLSMSDMFL